MVLTSLLLVFSIPAVCESVRAQLFIHTQDAIDIELVGYDGLAEFSLFSGNLAAGSRKEIDTEYRGLALIIFAGGQRYPVIIEGESSIVLIKSPAEPPSFTGSGENNLFYTLLRGKETDTSQYSFAHLMVQAKQMLESSHSIHTTEELTVKKTEFHEFIRVHYKSLKHSDMVRRLLAQYFMMHEYIDYHVKGAPATDIKRKYQEAVLDGVQNWLKVLKPHIPEHEILNYCVSLYYNRSMVALASLITGKFQDIAYCPGTEINTLKFDDKLDIIDKDGIKASTWEQLQGRKLIAFVSDDCPVSLVETVSKARLLANQKKDIVVVVAPLQKLSKKHLAMGRMLSTRNMYFIKDEEWRLKNLPQKAKLPFFVPAYYLMSQGKIN